LIRLMENFDVCFVVTEDSKKNFLDQRSILPGLIPTHQTPLEMERELQLARSEQEAAKGKKDKLDEEYSKKKADFDAGELNAKGEVKLRELERQLSEAKTNLKKIADHQTMSKRKQLQWQKLWPDEPNANQLCFFERVFEFETIPGEIVSKIIARLHSLIQEGSVFRNLLLLADGDSQCQVYVDTTLDRFNIEVRAPSLRQGEDLLKKVKDVLSKSLFEMLGDSAQSLVKDGVRSRFSNKLIPIEKFATLPDESHLDEDGFSDSVKSLKQRGGLLPSEVTARIKGWFSLEYFFPFFSRTSSFPFSHSFSSCKGK